LFCNEGTTVFLFLGHLWQTEPGAMNPALKRQFEAATAVDKVVEKQKQTRGREIGTVLDYDKAKGFGFLLDADSEKIFVHQSQIVSPGFRMLVKDQKVSFLRGENRGKPWAEDVRNPDGTQISQEKPEQSDSTMAKKRRQQLKEQWRNFFEIPQYAVKGYGESLPATVANQDAFALGETVPQLGKVFVMAHGCASSSGKGNEAATYAKEKLPKFIAKAYEDCMELGGSLHNFIDVHICPHFPLVGLYEQRAPINFIQFPFPPERKGSVTV
jgi:cold shock CspA family protein